MEDGAGVRRLTGQIRATRILEDTATKTTDQQSLKRTLLPSFMKCYFDETKALLELYGLTLVINNGQIDLLNEESKRIGSIYSGHMGAFYKGLLAAHKGKSNLTANPYKGHHGAWERQDKWEEWLRGYEIIRTQDSDDSALYRTKELVINRGEQIRFLLP